ncbi:MAG TPA: hypothetical protein VGG26_11315 [Terracidiphilus sp.]
MQQPAGSAAITSATGTAAAKTSSFAQSTVPQQAGSPASRPEQGARLNLPGSPAAFQDFSAHRAANLLIPESLPPQEPTDTGVIQATYSSKSSKPKGDSDAEPHRSQAKAVVDVSQTAGALPLPIPGPSPVQIQPPPKLETASAAIPDLFPSTKGAHSARTVLSVLPGAAIAGGAAAGPQPTPAGVHGAETPAIPNHRSAEGIGLDRLGDASLKISNGNAAKQGPEAEPGLDVDSGLAGEIQLPGASAAELAGAGGRPRLGTADAARRAVGSGSVEAASWSAHGLPAPAPATAGEVSAAAHASAGAHQAINPVAGTLRPDGGAFTASSASFSREPFAALDADTSSGPIPWTHAGARSAEAGFEDPALGWVGVRADLAAGGVHAAVVPGSAEAAQMLGTHMAGLQAYLSEQRAPVNTVTMASPSGMDMGFGQGTNEQMQQGHGRGDAEPGPPPPAENLRAGPLPGSAGSLAWRLPGVDPGAAGRLQARAGGHISVVA